MVSLIYGALLTISVRSGLGKHPAAIEPTAVLNAILWYQRGIPLGMLSVTLPTFAIAILLDNITDPLRPQRRLLYGVPLLNLVIRIVNVILVFTSCPPTSTLKGLRTGSNCFSPVVSLYYLYFAISELHLRRMNNLMFQAAYISTVGFSAATEVFLTLWPMVAFWRLQLRNKDKIILLLLFSTNALSVDAFPMFFVFPADLNAALPYATLFGLAISLKQPIIKTSSVSVLPSCSTQERVLTELLEPSDSSIDYTIWTV